MSDTVKLPGYGSLGNGGLFGTYEICEQCGKFTKAFRERAHKVCAYFVDYGVRIVIFNKKNKNSLFDDIVEYDDIGDILVCACCSNNITDLVKDCIIDVNGSVNTSKLMDLIFDLVQLYGDNRIVTSEYEPKRGLATIVKKFQLRKRLLPDIAYIVTSYL